jgi:hypothetical protein
MTTPLPTLSRPVPAPAACRAWAGGRLACLSLVAVLSIAWGIVWGSVAAHAQQSGATAAGDNVCKPAAPDAPGKRILGGDPAPKAKSAVGIIFSAGGRRSICTGVLISPSAVLTAGHCGCGTNYKLSFGEDMGRPDAVVAVNRVSLHPRYECARHGQAQPGADYAVLTFDANSAPADDTGQRAQPAAIMTPRAAQLSVLKPSASLYVVGYGLTEKEEHGFRLGTEVPVLSWDCAERWAEGQSCQPFSEIVLSEFGRVGRTDRRIRDSCQGDSGGPAFAASVEKDECTGQAIQRNYLVAITSRGMSLYRGEVDRNKNCGGGGIYEVVARRSVLTWLRGLGIDVAVHDKPAAVD